jgi:TatA/E family protein of Tat protein translocase
MLDIGFQELVVIMVIALLVFGPYKLPELGRALGRALREFRRASDEFRSTIETNLNITEDPFTSVGTPSAGAGVTTEPPPETPEPDLAAPTVAVEGPPSEEAAADSPSAVRAELVDPFCGPRNGRLLHRSTCAWAVRIPEGDRVVFKTAAEGLELGRSRCPVCDPVDTDATS